MVHGNRWAAVFVTVLGENAAAGLNYMKAIIPPIRAVSGMVCGYSAARRLEKILRESAAACGGVDVPLEYAIRFITLMAAQNQLKYADAILCKIEERIDERAGVVSVVIESAAALDPALIETFRRQIRARMGAADVKIRALQVPDLWGGYRLRMGGFYIDSSLKGQAEKMQADLITALAGYN